MVKKEKEMSEGCCEESPTSCCKIDAVVPIDARGQIVLPKDLREKAKMKAGDKLAVISWESEGEICCISLIRTDEFSESVKGMLGPMMKEALQ